MKVFLDDLRQPPDDSWVLVKTPAEAKAVLSTGEVELISLDHDLGDDEGIGTGYDVVCYIEKMYYVYGILPPKMQVHSANPSARQKMLIAIDNLNKVIDNE